MDFNYVNYEGLEHFYGNLKTFLSSKYTTKEELGAAIRNFGGFQVVTLDQQGYPDVASPSTKIIYLTKESGSQKTDPYTEWIYVSQGGTPETFAWEIIGETTPEINEMIGATASTAGTAGLVPAPAAGDQNKVLAGDATWRDFQTPARISYDSVTEELSLDFSPVKVGNIVNIGGRDYPYVQIGNQLWITENLDFKFSDLVIGQGSSSSESRANYYDNDEATYGINGNKYGLLYNWIAVKYLEDHKSTLLPDGWHVPTTTEWDALATAVGGSGVAGTKLKSTTGWSSGNGDGSYGFAAFPAGNRYSGSFNDLGSYAYFWAATEHSSSYAYYRRFDTGASMNSYYDNKSSGFSVRLVKTLT